MKVVFISISDVQDQQTFLQARGQQSFIWKPFIFMRRRQCWHKTTAYSQEFGRTSCLVPLTQGCSVWKHWSRFWYSQNERLGKGI